MDTSDDPTAGPWSDPQSHLDTDPVNDPDSGAGRGSTDDMPGEPGDPGDPAEDKDEDHA